MKIKKNGRIVTALCSRCKKELVPHVTRQGARAGRCPACGWILIPNEIVKEEEVSS